MEENSWYRDPLGRIRPETYSTWTATTTDTSGSPITIEMPSSHFEDSRMWDRDVLTGGWTSRLPMEDLIKKTLKDEEEFHMSHSVSRTEHSYDAKKHAVSCSDRNDLSQEHILKCISSMKGKLMIACAPIRVRNVECCMTPEVRKNIIQAGKRLKSFGKKPPIIAKFDDYGRRLPDESRLETLEGVTIKIVDPEDYGEFYLSFTGIVYESDLYETEPRFRYTDDLSIDYEPPF